MGFDIKKAVNAFGCLQFFTMQTLKCQKLFFINFSNAKNARVYYYEENCRNKHRFKRRFDPCCRNNKNFVEFSRRSANPRKSRTWNARKNNFFFQPQTYLLIYTWIDQSELNLNLFLRLRTAETNFCIK